MGRSLRSHNLAARKSRRGGGGRRHLAMLSALTVASSTLVAFAGVGPASAVVVPTTERVSVSSSDLSALTYSERLVPQSNKGFFGRLG